MMRGGAVLCLTLGLVIGVTGGIWISYKVMEPQLCYLDARYSLERQAW